MAQYCENEHCKDKGKPVYSVTIRNGKGFCKYCDQGDDNIKSFQITEKVYLKGYGYVEKSRLREMERRVILPYQPTDGSDYHVGRRGDNGRIQEREPSY